MPIIPPNGLDTAKLQVEIKSIYSKVATNPGADFHFHRGAEFAEEFLGYDPTDLADLPPENTASFAGVGNPHLIAPIVEGETVVDIGSGAGTDLFIAAKKVGRTGHATGIDMTDEMIEHARNGSAKLGLKHVEIKKGTAEDIPLSDSSVDVVITNGVINLTPDKSKAFSEIARILKPGARLQYSDIIMGGVLSTGAQKNIDLWTGWIAGALLEAELVQVLERAGFIDLKICQYFDAFRETSKAHIAKNYGVKGVNVFARLRT